MKTPVLMTTPEGKSRTFPNMEIARKALNLTRDNLIERIMTGEDTDGYSLDWGCGANTEETDAIELRWTLRKERLAEKKRRSRENAAAQKDLQDGWVQESYIQSNGNLRHVRIEAKSVVEIPRGDAHKLAD